jgi:hypothetical protein
LVDKYQVEQQRNIVVLGGIWKDTPLEVTDEEVRELRENVSKQIMKKLDDGLSS